jgi:5-oxoprolinase (ATP-hydrolysing) subunit A
VDLNCDIGEASPHLPDPPDAELFPLITRANIACGGHAGDDASMTAAIRAALAHRVAIGAHPAYPDREGFGRRALDLPPETVRVAVAGQVGRLVAIAADLGASVGHVKPHGALYGTAAADRRIADAVVAGALDAAGPVAVLGPPGSALEAAATTAGAGFVREGFPERGYRADGSLQPRGLPGALVDDPEDAARRALAMATGGAIAAVDGSPVRVPAETLCVHSDHPSAVRNAIAIRTLLAGAGVLPPPGAP